MSGFFDKYFEPGLTVGDLRAHYEPGEEEYKAAAISQASKFERELHDIAVRYNCSILGKMEVEGAIQDGPGAAINKALNQLIILKQSL